jgi:pilus assembly protein CpaF
MVIRKFTSRRFTVEDLIARGTLSRPLAEFLAAQIEDGKTILISGGTGTGKTTLLNILGQSIPDHERIVVIEDTAELHIEKPNILPVECQTDTHRKPVTFDDLLKAALRWRPDRIILGEVRGIEARTLLDSFNTGHARSLATIHANSAAKALRRFANLVLRSHSQATFADIEAEIGESVDFGFDVAREPGRRVIREVLRLNGYDRALQRFNYEMVYGADTISNPNHFHDREVAVGIRISPYPPHRSGQADFPHPALASGGDAQTARGIRMADMGRRKPAADEPLHSLPLDATILASPRERDARGCSR